MRLAGFESQAQRLARAEEMLLADDFVDRAREQGGRSRAEGLRQLAYRGLLELPIVDTDPLAVADDQLLHRLVVDPAEAAGPHEHEASLCPLHELAIAVEDLLLEIGARRLRRAHEALEALDGGRLNAGRREEREEKQEPHRAGHSALAGTSTSRLPLDCIGDTMPERSMSSIRRAARLYPMRR